MAGIVLKDRNSNEVTHEGVVHIQVPFDSGSTVTYTNMDALYVYFASYDSTTTKYTIQGLWMCVKGAGYALSATDEAQAAAYPYMIFTTKMLKTGESYFESELGGV